MLWKWQSRQKSDHPLRRSRPDRRYPTRYGRLNLPKVAIRLLPGGRARIGIKVAGRGIASAKDTWRLGSAGLMAEIGERDARRRLRDLHISFERVG